MPYLTYDMCLRHNLYILYFDSLNTEMISFACCRLFTLLVHDVKSIKETLN